jgi:hypothetical protein
MSKKPEMMDFDAAMAESENQPVMFKWGGCEYAIAPAIPAKAVLMIHRDRGKALSEEQQSILIESALSKETFDALVEAGISMPQLADIGAWALLQHGIVLTSKDEPKNPEAPTGAD